MDEKKGCFTLAIDTPDGIISVPVRHTVANENDDKMHTAITVAMQENEMCFDAETTEKVLIEFANSLPADWKIRSCISCRYGQFCPVGNADNELFCVNDFEPNEVCDLWYVTEDEAERTIRSRNLFHLCDLYVPQSDDYFTYNDFYSEVEKH